MRGFGGGMGNLMAQAQKMQERLAKVQEQIGQMEFEGEAANGAVKVVVTGKNVCKGVKIDPSVVDPDDVEMLEDLLLLAFNNAHEKAEKTSSEMMNRACPLPAGMKLPF